MAPTEGRSPIPSHQARAWMPTDRGLAAPLVNELAPNEPGTTAVPDDGGIGTIALSGIARARDPGLGGSGARGAMAVPAPRKAALPSPRRAADAPRVGSGPGSLR